MYDEFEAVGHCQQTEEADENDAGDDRWVDSKGYLERVAVCVEIMNNIACTEQEYH